MKKTVVFLAIGCILLSMVSAIVFPAAAATELTNLWNYTSEYNGTVNGNTGNLGGNTNYYTSKELIPVSAGNVVTFGVNIAGSQSYQLALYDSIKAYIGYVYTADLKASALSTGNDTYIYKYTIGSGVGYIRASVRSTYAEKYILTLNQPFNLDDYNAYWNVVTPELPGDGSLNEDHVSTSMPLTNAYAKNQATNADYYFTSAALTVAKGDVFYFGPCKTVDSYQGTFYASGDTVGAQLTTSALTLKGTFGDGSAIYAWQAAASGTITFRMADEYNDTYVVTRNQQMTVEKFFAYWAEKEHANLYSSLLDAAGTTHKVMVAPGETLYFGPIAKDQTSFGSLYNSSMKATALTLSDFTAQEALSARFGFYSYTVPADGAYLQISFPAALNQVFYMTKKDADIEDYRDQVFYENYLDAESNFYGKTISVSVGDRLYFGPVDPSAASLLKVGNTVVTPADCAITDLFPDGSALMVYQAEVAGVVSAIQTGAYEEVFFVARNTALARQNYYEYWDRSGANLLHPADGTRKTHSVSVNFGEVVTFGPVSAENAPYGTVYDANMENPKAIGYAALTAVEGKEGYYTYAIPEGYYYLELNAPNQDFTATYVYDATTILGGKTALFVGDSICFGSQGGDERSWPERIAASHGLLSTNNGISGWSYSTVRPGRQIITQLQSAAGNTYDYVLLHGGVNDAWSNAPVGTISTSYDIADYDDSTFAGAFEAAVYTAIDLFGDHSSIAYLINFEAPQCKSGMVSQMDDYVAVAKAICEKWNIPYFDMYTNKKIAYALRMDGRAYGGGAYDLLHRDYIHPRDLGYERLVPYIANYMTTMTPYVSVMAGDVNSDFEVDLLDALFLVRKLSGNLPADAEARFSLQAANVVETYEGEYEVNTADITRLLQYITGVWVDGKPIELFYSETVPSIVV